MFYSILLVTAIAAMLYAIKRWQALPVDQRKGFGFKAMLWGGAAIVLALVLSGRAHWLMGVFAALIALAGRAVQLAQYAPILRKVFGEFQQAGDASPGTNSPPSHSAMSRQEAAEILGVNNNATEDEIRLAHKKLMQKMHPDRGGTDALAKQINIAKDTLLA